MSYSILAFREKHVIAQRDMKWLWIFLFRSICGAGLFHAVLRVMCLWPLAHSGDNSSLPEGLPKPRSAVSILLVLGNKALCLSHLPKDSCLVFVKKKKKLLRPWRGACLLKTPLKALSASFLSVSCQNGCNLNFTTVKFISCPWCCPDWLYHTHMLVKW